MDNKSQAILFTLTSMQQLVIDNPCIKTDIPEFVTDSDGMDTNIARVLTADLLKGKINNISAEDVAAAKLKMSKTVFKFIGKAQVICGQSKNTTLLNKFNFASDYITKPDKGNAILHAKEIKELINANLLTGLSNIKPADVIQMNTDITAFDTIKDIPVLSIKNKKNLGTAIINQALTEGRAQAERMFLSIKIQYETSNPDLVSLAEDTLKIVVLGVRYTPTNITLIDDATGKFIPNGKITRTKKSGKINTYVSNVDGVVVFKTHKAGKTTYSVQITGYPATEFTITVKRGQTNNIIIRLTKLP